MPAAKAALEQSRRIEPNFYRTHSLLGLISIQSRQWNQAQRHFERALSRNPNDAVAHYNLGIALFNKGEVQRAKRQFEESLRIDPNYQPARASLTKIAPLLKKDN